MNKSTVTFADLSIGDMFIEVFSTCNEVATKIEPATHRGKSVNAQRDGGKMIFMGDWEPVSTPEEIIRNFTRSFQSKETRLTNELE